MAKKMTTDLDMLRMLKHKDAEPGMVMNRPPSTDGNLSLEDTIRRNEQQQESLSSSPVHIEKKRLEKQVADLQAQLAASQNEGEERVRQLGEQLAEAERQYQAQLGRAAALEQTYEALRLAREAGGRMEVPFSQLVEVPGRRRKLRPDHYQRLHDNIKQYGQSSPVSVLPLADGRFEIISGTNRAHICNELDRPVPIWLASESEVRQAEEVAFYANLFQTELPPYEIYQGLVKLREANPELDTIDALAQRTGLSKSGVGRFLGFSHFGEEAITMLELNPWLVTSRGVDKLTRLSKLGMHQEVVDLLKLKTRSTEPGTKIDGQSPTGPGDAGRPGASRFVVRSQSKTSLRIEQLSPAQKILLEEMLPGVLNDLLDRVDAMIKGPGGQPPARDETSG